MLSRFSPSTVLNPTGVSILYGALVMTSYEEHETFIIALGAAICGIYLGSAWRGAHERWIQQVWRFLKPDGWISEKARRAYSDRYKLLGYWLIRCLLNAVFFALVLVSGSLFFYVLSEFISNRVSLWLALPAMAIVGPLLSLLPMVPYSLYKKWASEQKTFLGRMEAELQLMNDLSSELPKLKEWDEKQQRLITAGLASVDKA